MNLAIPIKISDKEEIMKAQIEIITTFCNTVEKCAKNKVPYKQECTTKISATIKQDDTICIHNVNPFKEVEESDYDYLKVVKIDSSGIKLELNNVLSEIVDENLPVFVLNNQTLKPENKMLIELSVGQGLFVDDSFDTIQRSVNIKLISVGK